MADLRQRLGLRRVVFAGDRGMVPLKNMEQLRQAGQAYLVGLPRRNRKQIPHYIEQAVAQQDWQKCPVGITAAQNSVGPRMWAQEAPGQEPGVRVFVVHSQPREPYERGLREQSRERARKEPEQPRRRVEKGEFKQAEKIGPAAAKIFERQHGHRYFAWELRQGQFHYFEHPVNRSREQPCRGNCVIQSEKQHLRPVEAVTAYNPDFRLEHFQVTL